MRNLNLKGVAMLCAIMAPLVFAQSDRGTITGVVRDASSMSVPAAEVRIVNEATGITSSTVTSETGNYTLPILPIGAYTITVQHAGFKTYVRNAIPVQVGQTTRIDIVLEIGQLEEKVTVTAEAPLISIDTSDVGTVINQQRFLDLPLALGGDIRNASSFIFLSPGVAGDTWEKHIAGGGSFTDAVYYDGVALQVAPNNDIQYNPSVDAIQEFKLITNVYSSEYGHAMSGVTSFTLKSGTNEFHGNAFEFFRNEKLDARGFFSPNRLPTRQNEFGGTFGGPIRKNKTFFFTSLDSFRRRQGSTPAVTTVAVPEFLAGDFRRWPSAIYDPTTTRADGQGGFTRLPFADNQIPADHFSNVSKQIVPLLPAPSFPDLISNNFTAPLVSPMQDAHNWTLKLDHQLSSYHKLFGTFFMTNRPAIKGWGPSVPGPAESHNRQDLNSRFLRVGYDWTISPTMLNHFVASIDRVVDTNHTLSRGKGWPQKLGLTGVQGDVFPMVYFNQGYALLGDGSNYRAAMTTWGLQDTISMNRGRHALKFGAEVMRHQDNYNDEGGVAGTYNFSNLETALPGSPDTGNAFASFLVGAVDSASAQFHTTELGARWTYFGAFAQDDFKVSQKLTLNLGLRWEVQNPFSDVLDRFSYMDPKLPNPGAGDRPGAYTFAGTRGGNWKTLGDTVWANFGPRFGFAYNFRENWVVRGGYGIFFLNQTTVMWIPTADGFNTYAGFFSPNAGITPAFNWDDGFPQNFPHPPITTPTVQNGLNATLNLRSRAGVWPYSQQWNFTVERQLGRSASIRTSYVGIHGTRLWNADGTQWNQVYPSNLQLGDLLTAPIDSPEARAAGFGEPFPGFSNLWGGRATVAQSLRPFPQYGGIWEWNGTYGSSIYHSFQLYGQKRLAAGFDFTVAYTFSKLLDDTNQIGSGSGGYQNYYDRRAERSLSANDQTHAVSLSYVYQLPFGPGRKYLNTGAASKAFGGWLVSGIQRYASGTPIAVSTVNNLPIFNGILRPNVVPNADLHATTGPGGFDPARDLYINPAAFTDPAPFTFGNAPRYLALRNFGTRSESFAVVKDTALHERVSLQFRLELSNPFNRVVFGSPVNDMSAQSFGRIGSQQNNPRNLQLGLKLIW